MGNIICVKILPSCSHTLKFHYFCISANKQWVHPPDTLTRGHIVYNVKVSKSHMETHIKLWEECSVPWIHY
jgi:hypothetical protein